ncbi:MAG: flagellar hook assembly protein FlgD [Magnetospirillum sp.]|nr:flagellar hook assembly protein FlgD [Magnetospirillum sp.]
MNAASTASSADTKSSLSRSKLASNFDTFLTMLTTQLKHQDPLSPMDSTQFTSQLVQFANVEQQINANTNLEKLIGIQSVNQTSMAIGYLGQTVEVPTVALALQDGKAAFSYTLPEEAKAIAVQIKDSAGKYVATLKSATGESGRHEMTWDGKDSNGNAVKDGVYQVSIIAAKADGTELGTGVSTYGRVTDVSSDSSGTLLSLSGVVTAIDQVLTIRETASLKN